MSRDEDTAQLCLGVYEHYKGDRYLVMGVARDDACEGDERLLVIYSRLYGRGGVPLCARPLEEFTSMVETPEGMRPRFAYIGYADSAGRSEPVINEAN